MKFLIFSGTTEGKQVWTYLKNAGAKSDVFVATEYGAQVMPDEAQKNVFVGRLNVEGMKELFFKEKDSVVIDATHPYAFEVSKNLKEASSLAGIEYLRFLRPSTYKDGVMEFDSVEKAVDYLSLEEGNVLLTTGSKDLAIFAKVKNFQERLYPRILPATGAVENCVALGYKPKNIICMQGPFSMFLNAAIMNQINAKFLVTKDTGKVGGFDEKIEAASMVGAKVVMIKRREEYNTLDFDELKKVLYDKFGVKSYSGETDRDDYSQTLNFKGYRNYFPLFFNLELRKFLFIGGGRVTERRVKSLLNYRADITVLSPGNTYYIENMAKQGLLTLIKDKFEEKYINKEYFFITAATNDKELNEKIGRSVKSKGILVNIASDLEECDFFFSALIQGGGVTGGIISERGKDHSLTSETAKKLRLFLSIKENFK